MQSNEDRLLTMAIEVNASTAILCALGYTETAHSLADAFTKILDAINPEWSGQGKVARALHSGTVAGILRARSA